MALESAGPARTLFADDFSGGFLVAGESARWRLRPVPGFPAGDGVVRSGPDGLVVVPTANWPGTGEPAFGDPPVPPGSTDHLRWTALAARDAPSGTPGFEAGERPLLLTAELAVRAYGLERHTYGDEVVDRRRDLRLGSGALIFMDRESRLVLDFIVTDGCVFAVYERLAFPGDDHAAFSYAVPVLDREPDQFHELGIQYDPAAGSATWRVGDVDVLAVDRLGYRALESRFLMRDNGGAEKPAVPRQLVCGLALFADRLWGQGVRLAVRQVRVSAMQPTRSHDEQVGQATGSR